MKRNTRIEKRKVTVKKLQFEVLKTDPKSLTGLEEFGIYQTADGKGVTFGRPMQYHELRGEGLPDLDEREKIDGWTVEFDIRVCFDHTEGTAYLDIAQKGSGTHHRFPFSGLDFRKSQLASGQFNNHFDILAINLGFYPLFWAYFRGQDSRENADIAYEKILANFAAHFKAILKPKRLKQVQTIESDGLRITSFERVERGRNPQSEKQLAKEKEVFAKKYFEALHKLESDGIRVTQENIGACIFVKALRSNPDLNVTAKLQHSLKKYGLRDKDLRDLFRRQRNRKN